MKTNKANKANVVTEIVEDLKAKLDVEILKETEDRIEGYNENWGEWDCDIAYEDELYDDEDEDELYDEDDEELLTEDSHKELVEIINSLNEKYKDYKFDYEFSEKNYIDFTVIKK